jgi:hypothetical protein
VSIICHMDPTTIGIILLAYIVIVPLLSTFLAVESRPDFLRIDRKPRFRMGGSMDPKDWPPSEFER